MSGTSPGGISGFEFREGSNCWRVVPASRFTVLVDAQEYFSAFLASLKQARREVRILGWDIDARMRIAEGLSLGQALRDALRARPSLRISVLCWDFAMMYSLERRFFPKLERAFRHPRIDYRLDDRHPFGASHHQKLVVIDREVAFAGGLDLCSRRWDTRSHLAWDRRRVDRDGKPYEPFHDIHSVVEGPAAAALAEIADHRWHAVLASEGEGPKEKEEAQAAGISGPSSPVWPEGVAAQFVDVPLAIVRSFASDELGDSPRTVSEIEQLNLDLIAACRRFLYVENQYVTSDAIAEALIRRLQEPDGPEILILVPLRNIGWIEQITMGVARARVLRRLRAADRWGRLRVLSPIVKGRWRDIPISLHSKFVVMDDQALRVGSSNWSNRSMGLDSELDVAIAASGRAEVAAKIRSIRDSLLAEHLGLSSDAVSKAIAAHPESAFAALDALMSLPGRPRNLIPLRVRLPVWVDWWVPDSSVIDPGVPIGRDPYFGQFIPEDRLRFLRAKYRGLQFRVAIALLLAALAAWPPFRAHWDLPGLLGQARQWGQQPGVDSWAILGLVLGVWVTLPADLLIVVACGVFGIGRAWTLCLFGLGLTSAIGFVAGRLQRRDFAPAERPGVGGGGFWAGFLLHLSLFRSFVALAARAGRLRTPGVRFLAGSLWAQAIRVSGVAAFYAVWEEALLFPSVPRGVALIGASWAVLSLFRWSSQKLLPVDHRRGRLSLGNHLHFSQISGIKPLSKYTDSGRSRS